MRVHHTHTLLQQMTYSPINVTGTGRSQSFRKHGKTTTQQKQRMLQVLVERFRGLPVQNSVSHPARSTVPFCIGHLLVTNHRAKLPRQPKVNASLSPPCRHQRSCWVLGYANHRRSTRILGSASLSSPCSLVVFPCCYRCSCFHYGLKSRPTAYCPRCHRQFSSAPDIHGRRRRLHGRGDCCCRRHRRHHHHHHHHTDRIVRTVYVLPSLSPVVLRSFVVLHRRSRVRWLFLRSFVPSFLRSFVPSFLRSFVRSFVLRLCRRPFRHFASMFATMQVRRRGTFERLFVTQFVSAK